MSSLGAPSFRFGHHAIADGNLAFLREARQLRRLALDSAKITDASAEELARFTGITELDLTSRKITGETLKQIGKLTQLKKLSICSPNFKDKDLGHLRTLTNLTHLNLEANEFGDDGLAHLGPLPKLWVIYVGAQTTDASIPALIAMPNLRNAFGARKCRITRAGWTQLNEVLHARSETGREYPGSGSATSGPQPSLILPRED